MYMYMYIHVACISTIQIGHLGEGEVVCLKFQLVRACLFVEFAE